MDWDWGSVPDWLAAIGTISAVMLALHLGRRDGKRLAEERLEAKADREAAANERAEYAKQREEALTVARRRLAAQVTIVVEPSDKAKADVKPPATSSSFGVEGTQWGRRTDFQGHRGPQRDQPRGRISNGQS